MPRPGLNRPGTLGCLGRMRPRPLALALSFERLPCRTAGLAGSATPDPAGRRPGAVPGPGNCPRAPPKAGQAASDARARSQVGGDPPPGFFPDRDDLRPLRRVSEAGRGRCSRPPAGILDQNVKSADSADRRAEAPARSPRGASPPARAPALVRSRYNVGNTVGDMARVPLFASIDPPPPPPPPPRLGPSLPPRRLHPEPRITALQGSLQARGGVASTRSASKESVSTKKASSPRSPRWSTPPENKRGHGSSSTSRASTQQTSCPQVLSFSSAPRRPVPPAFRRPVRLRSTGFSWTPAFRVPLSGGNRLLFRQPRSQRPADPGRSVVWVASVVQMSGNVFVPTTDRRADRTVCVRAGREAVSTRVTQGRADVSLVRPPLPRLVELPAAGRGTFPAAGSGSSRAGPRSRRRCGTRIGALRRPRLAGGAPPSPAAAASPAPAWLARNLTASVVARKEPERFVRLWTVRQPLYQPPGRPRPAQAEIAFAFAGLSLRKPPPNSPI